MHFFRIINSTSTSGLPDFPTFGLSDFRTLIDATYISIKTIDLIYHHRRCNLELLLRNTVDNL